MFQLPYIWHLLGLVLTDRFLFVHSLHTFAAQMNTSIMNLSKTAILTGLSTASFLHLLDLKIVTRYQKRDTLL